VRATAVEERLAGVEITEEVVTDAVAGLGATLEPPSDVHGTADYRRALAEVAVVRAVLQAADRAGGA
jgi:aerobic carbon-monoxide dehydrogenase medium subunit